MSAEHSSTSKAPENSNGGFRAHAAMTVEPPKAQDLQQSYATIVGNDAGPKGWYGTMGKWFSSSSTIVAACY
jgi:erythrocyte band 7 integral membrane protein